MHIQYEQRAYFKTQLFNETTNQFNDIVLANLVKHNRLISAKGSSKYNDLSDMPYHIHIINGIYPALLLLEKLFQKNQIECPFIEQFLKAFIMGFTLHDLNKLTNEDNLQKTVEKNLISYLEKLETDKFFPEWREYINEIKFIILKTEERTRNLANDLQVKERQFVNDYLAEASQLADKFGSIKNFNDISSFFNQVKKITFKSYKKISDIWNLSYVGINENIYTLLSQKLLSIVRDYINNEKQNDILFNLRNGIVYIGDPLHEDDIGAIKQRFSNPIQNEINPVEATKIDEQQVDFGFTDVIQLNKDQLLKIVKGHLTRKLLAINKNEFFNIGDHNNNLSEIIPELIDKNHLPLELVFDRDKNKWVKIVYPLNQEWDDLDKDEQKILYAIGLEKIKYLTKKRWESEFKKSVEMLLKNYKIDFKKEPKRTIKTLAAIQKVCFLLEKNSIDEIINNQEEEILEHFFPKIKNQSGSDIWSQFIDMNLIGNYDREPDNLNFNFDNIPIKSEMCMVCGKQKTIEYREAKSFGFRPRNFSNKSYNILKNNVNFICDICNTELQLRRSLFTKNPKKNSVCIYFDMGDYFINYDKRSIINMFSDVIEMDFDSTKNNILVTIEKMSIDYDFYSLVFYILPNDTESHFYFIRKMLRIISQLSFKIYVQDLISPYHLKKEMFAFEGCMPFVKKLGWDKVRIDEIQQVLNEISLFLAFTKRNVPSGQKHVTSNVLKYAEDRLEIFSIFYRLSEEDRKIVVNKLTDFVIKNKEKFVMSVMDKITDYAVKASWGFGSMGEETWMIREALEILKLGSKDKLDRDTIIEQIAGMLYKKLKGDAGNVDQTNLYSFATSVYDDLFINEWNGKIPQPGRMKNWIYQFAFLYSMKSLKQIKIKAINKVKKELEGKGEKVTEETIINELSKDDNKKKYIDQYREVYRESLKSQ